MTFSYGLLLMDTPVLVDQPRLRYVTSVRTLDTVYKTYQEQWMIGEIDRQIDSRISVLSELDDNDDDDHTHTHTHTHIYIYIYIYIYIRSVYIFESVCMYPTTPQDHDSGQGQFLSEVQQVSVQTFPSLRSVATPSLKITVCPSIYP